MTTTGAHAATVERVHLPAISWSVYGDPADDPVTSTDEAPAYFVYVDPDDDGRLEDTDAEEVPGWFTQVADRMWEDMRAMARAKGAAPETDGVGRSVPVDADGRPMPWASYEVQWRRPYRVGMEDEQTVVEPLGDDIALAASVPSWWPAIVINGVRLLPCFTDRGAFIGYVEPDAMHRVDPTIHDN